MRHGFNDDAGDDNLNDGDGFSNDAGDDDFDDDRGFDNFEEY
jgi:hypothetical protein